MFVGVRVLRACTGTSRDTLVQQERVDAKKVSSRNFSNVLALSFGAACANCLQVGAIFNIKLFFSACVCVFGHVGKIIQGLCHECGFILVE